MKRTHATIVFTDVVCYFTLMDKDEDHAFVVLSKNREIQSKIIKQSHGTLIKEMGNGMLIQSFLAAKAR